MSAKKFPKTFRTIALLISILMIWQGVVWANPEIFNRNTIQVRSLAAYPEMLKSDLRFLASYIPRKLERLENDPGKQNIHALYEDILYTLDEINAFLVAKRGMSAERVKSAYAVVENLSEGHFRIDIGNESIRYYAANIDNAENPEFSSRILSDEPIGSGRYLRKQVLARETGLKGYIAKGDPYSLFREVLSRRDEIRPLSGETAKVVKKAKKDIRKKILKSGLAPGTRKQLLDILESADPRKFRTFKAIVLPDLSRENEYLDSLRNAALPGGVVEEFGDIYRKLGSGEKTVFFFEAMKGDNTKETAAGLIGSKAGEASGLTGFLRSVSGEEFDEFKKAAKDFIRKHNWPGEWLLGFNSLAGRRAVPPEGEEGLRDNLRREFGEIIGFAEEVLEVASRDEEILQEYIFHETMCPFTGHYEARELQEKLFRDNYPDSKGTGDDGHADGELTLLLKKVILEKRSAFRSYSPSDKEIAEGLKMAETSDFRGDGPEKITRFHTLFKEWYRVKKEELLIGRSRLLEKVPLKAVETLEKMLLKKEFLRLKEIWVWSLEGTWTEIEKFMPFDQLDTAGKRKARALAEEALRRHRVFLKEYPEWSKFFEESYFESSLESIVYMLAGSRSGYSGLIPDELRASPDIEEITGDDREAEDPVLERSAPETGGSRTETRSPEPVNEIREEPATSGGKDTAGSIFRNIFSWRTFTVIGIALALSAVLRAVLPVNGFTVMLSAVLPLMLFVYLMARNWSLRNLLVALAFSAVISTFISAPLFGLSLALVIIAGLFFHRSGVHGRPGRSRSAKARPSGEKRTSGKGERRDEERKKESVREEGPATPREDIKRKRSETPKKETREDTTHGRKKADPLEEVYISSDILEKLLKIAELLYGGKRERTTPSGTEHVPKKLTTRSVLDDCVFRISNTGAITVDRKNKEELRPIVFRTIEKMETFRNMEVVNAGNNLRNWKTMNNIALADSLKTVHEEVNQEVFAGRGEKESGESMAVYELIA
ncbi:MAG: hypothetical protein GF392_02095, partial [Candidatus Omnitrophica bacterium]|nr:hypothetical protein [Candidatus Omnitrophota bacterium]